MCTAVIVILKSVIGEQYVSSLLFLTARVYFCNFLWFYVILPQPTSCFTEERGQALYIICEARHCPVAQCLLTLATAALGSPPSGKI